MQYQWHTGGVGEWLLDLWMYINIDVQCLGTNPPCHTDTDVDSPLTPTVQPQASECPDVKNYKWRSGTSTWQQWASKGVIHRWAAVTWRCWVESVESLVGLRLGQHNDRRPVHNRTVHSCPSQPPGQTITSCLTHTTTTTIHPITELQSLTPHPLTIELPAHTTHLTDCTFITLMLYKLKMKALYYFRSG